MLFSPPIEGREDIEISVEELMEALSQYDFDPLEEVLEELRDEYDVDDHLLDEFVENLREDPELLEAAALYIADDFIQEEDLDYDYYQRRFVDDLLVYLFQQWQAEEE
jgi:hypothetical protein